MSIKQKNILVYAPPFDPNSGGVVALHRLCHLINEFGRSSFLLPNFPKLRLDAGTPEERAENLNKTIAFQHLYPVNPRYNTPIVRAELFESLHTIGDSVILYPELIYGNPLKGRHIARWFMHNPGYFTNAVYYHTGELYFKFGHETKPAIIPGSKLSDSILEVTHFPLEFYNAQGWSDSRSGTAYCLRKGKNKKIIHSLEDSILIDGKSHEEIASIFKRVKQFISYDSRTSYSKLAVLCGCESVVVPDDGLSEQDWSPDSFTRAGVAYGFDRLEEARNSAHLVPEYYAQRESVSRASVQAFLAEVDSFFTGY